jgi:hypothetical protein
MANKKLTQLPELQSADVDGADIIPVVDDIGGTPITKKVTITNLMSQAPVQQADIADFATQVSLGNVQVSLGNLQASLGTAATTASSDYATSAQGVKADSAQQPPSEGAFADGDKTKLDGIEASADVTDTANVTSAGALMDSEVTNLADVKAFDTTDYATSAQGAKADSALQNAGVDLSVSGNILKLIDPNGTQIGSNIDLSLYLDDTNLARITSGTLASSGIATFTRDDSTTFTIDLSNLTAVDSVNTQTGAVVLDADDIDDASTAHKFVTASDLTNLGNLSGTNTGDQDLSSYQLQPSEGAFVNGDKTKLDGIESSADVTDATNVEAAGALMDSEVTNLSQVKAFDSSDYATSAQGTTADSAIQPGTVNPVYFANQSAFPSASSNHGAIAHSHADGAMYFAHGGSWIPLANDSDLASIEGSAVLSTGETGGTKFLREDGDGTCSFQSVSITDENLRGTDNPHIGAFPNQSLKVLDNPSKSGMIVIDSDGSIKFVAKDTTANVFIKKGGNALSRLAEASELPSFIISKDSGEPDIELTDSDGEKYSVVSGDSDTLGTNGIPTRQGYQLPSMGANPAPLLISGGTIS